MAETVLVATLGGQPQVVTFALDALRARGETITTVYLFHLALDTPRQHHALQKLYSEFTQHQYQGRPCRLAPIAIGGADPLPAIRNAAEAEVAWVTIRDTLASLKQQGHTLHLSIAGGRRMLALLATSAAMLLCDHQDRLWHLYTPDALRERAAGGAIMHVTPGDGVQLIQTPLAPWGAYFPALRAMALPPAQAVAQQMQQLSATNDLQCRQVYQGLTERQQEILLAFVRGGTPQDVAEALTISLSTVNTHKTAILAECRIAWGLAEEARLDYRFLKEHFAGFLARLGKG